MSKKVAVKTEVKRNNSAFASLERAQKEQSLQRMIERYQLANKKANYNEDARANRAKAALALIITRENAMIKEGLTPLSNYRPLADIFHTDLAGLTDVVFVSEAESKIAFDLGKFGTRKIEPAIEEVIATYHTNTAKKAMDTVNNIRILLTRKGLLTGKEAANVKALENMLLQNDQPTKVAASA